MASILIKIFWKSIFNWKIYLRPFFRYLPVDSAARALCHRALLCPPFGGGWETSDPFRRRYQGSCRPHVARLAPDRFGVSWNCFIVTELFMDFGKGSSMMVHTLWLRSASSESWAIMLGLRQRYSTAISEITRGMAFFI